MTIFRSFHLFSIEDSSFLMRLIANCLAISWEAFFPFGFPSRLFMLTNPHVCWYRLLLSRPHLAMSYTEPYVILSWWVRSLRVLQLLLIGSSFLLYVVFSSYSCLLWLLVLMRLSSWCSFCWYAIYTHISVRSLIHPNIAAALLIWSLRSCTRL